MSNVDKPYIVTEEQLEKLEIIFQTGMERVFENVSEKSLEGDRYIIHFKEWDEYMDKYIDYWVVYHWSDIFSIKIWDQL